MTKRPELSIVVLSYNTKDLLLNCLKSLAKVSAEIPFETIVVDNASTDGSGDALSKFMGLDDLRVIINSENLGFARGNNSARKYVRGKYILFLNSDTIVYPQTLKATVDYLRKHPSVGALSCKTLLPNGELDKDARRSFPTPGVSFMHLILGINKYYWYESQDPNETAEVDVIQGAYFLVRKKILDDVDWFDEEYFLDGEDIDLCWKIRQRGYSIIYYPEVSILHIKGASKGKEGKVGKVDKLSRIKYRLAGVDSMAIFYKKRLWDRYPLILSFLVLAGIYTIRTYRLVKTLLRG